jgi:hypothetical protein
LIRRHQAAGSNPVLTWLVNVREYSNRVAGVQGKCGGNYPDTMSGFVSAYWLMREALAGGTGLLGCMNCLARVYVVAVVR